MANYHIGLDFGTSQTKVCLLNTDAQEREFVKFENQSFFIPTLITKTNENKFVFGNEHPPGHIYRYFKMATAEDEELLQATNEDLTGTQLSSHQLDSFRKYNKNADIKPEILSILYIAYVVLFVKQLKENNNQADKKTGGLLGKFGQERKAENNSFSVKMGIPTEWHNLKHVKRKIKFETVLIAVKELCDKFSSLENYLETDADSLINSATEINRIHSVHVDSLALEEKKEYILNLLNRYKLSVYPETAAGIAFLLATERLKNGYYAAMDIGAGTSDISVFRVYDNRIQNYLCSESVELASNDVYAEYANLIGGDSKYENIKIAENDYHANKVNPELFKVALSEVKRELQFILRKTYYRKHFYPLKEINSGLADSIRVALDKQPLILYGGGGNFNIINEDAYMYFQTTANPFTQHNNRLLNVVGVKNYIDQVDIKESVKVKEQINLLVLALGLSYLHNDSNDELFLNINNVIPPTDDDPSTQNYFYYDIQDAVFK